nr:2OG-Fe dioxygenase family protein [Lysobacter dokdonensis]
MRETLAGVGGLDDWPAFAASWEQLGPDPYLARTGRARKRRHAVFVSNGGVIERAQHQPHFQTSEYNALQGDIERWFEPVTDAVAEGACLQTMLRYCVGFFGSLAPDVARWRIEVHQFRIEARPGEAGEPTPEGVHRDGVDYVLVLMVDRRNIESGTTTIHLADGTELGSFTLTQPFDAALVDDARVFHGVTAVTALDPSEPAHRDVLVVTLKRG